MCRSLSIRLDISTSPQHLLSIRTILSTFYPQLTKLQIEKLSKNDFGWIFLFKKSFHGVSLPLYQMRSKLCPSIRPQAVLQRFSWILLHNTAVLVCWNSSMEQINTNFKVCWVIDDQSVDLKRVKPSPQIQHTSFPLQCTLERKSLMK